jgi:hypothetical protein
MNGRLRLMNTRLALSGFLAPVIAGCIVAPTGKPWRGTPAAGGAGRLVAHRRVRLPPLGRRDGFEA